MSTTRAEAIERLEKLIALYEMASTENKMIDYSGIIDTLKFSLAALRPVSREKVEKVFPGCQMCEGWNTIKLNPCANGDLGVQADIGSSGKGDTFGLVVYNRRLASGYVNFQFCPFCGKPKTDEAVEMVMERMEKIK